MVAPAVTHRETLIRRPARALARATAEHIVVYRRVRALGVATVTGGIFTRKPYTLSSLARAPAISSAPALPARRAHLQAHRCWHLRPQVRRLCREASRHG